MPIKAILRIKVYLMALASKVMRQMFPHILQHINFAILHPATISSTIKPKGEPVRPPISLNMVVELQLCDSIASEMEPARQLGALFNTSIVAHSLGGDVSCNRRGVHGDVGRMHEPLVFPAAVAATVVGCTDIAVEHLGGINSIPVAIWRIGGLELDRLRFRRLTFGQVSQAVEAELRKLRVLHYHSILDRVCGQKCISEQIRYDLILENLHLN